VQRRTPPQAAAADRRRACQPACVSFADLPTPPFTGGSWARPESLMRFVDWQFFFHAWS
jgi:hypothetical protein